MLDIYKAKTIITMNPSLPRAEAIAIADGQIVQVGRLSDMEPLMASREHVIHAQFANDVMTPGLIDPHLHPAMAAVILPMEFITAMEWRLPWATIPATTTPQAYDERLQALIAAHPPGELLIAWGHHELWHGEMSRARINQFSSELPIVIWNRSFHELCMNDAALNMLGINAAAIGQREQIDLERGRFFEVGLSYAIGKLNPIILAPEWFERGMQRLVQVVHFGGQTTVGDMAVGIFDFATEMATQQKIIEEAQAPFRVELIPHSAALSRGRTADEVADFIDTLPATNSHRLRYAKRVKLFADGAFFSGLAQLLPPGYLDGHQGEWLVTPPELEQAVRRYWQRNYQIHVHVTGDLGLELVLDILSLMQDEKPRIDHGFTIEHFGLSTPEQVSRAARLGARVSANIYYLHELSDIFAKQWVGQERAEQMGRIGSCFREGITTTLHSDFTMAPAQPLNSMWVAVNRINCEGNVMGPNERISPEQALRAVTINAATVLGCENEIGSLRAGKKADITVLGADPLTVDPITIKDIPIKATLFEGQVFPIQPITDPQ